MELPVPMGVLHGAQEEYGTGRSVMPTMVEVNRKTGTVVGKMMKGTNKSWGCVTALYLATAGT